MNTDIPNPIDPRGLATFGLAAVGHFTISWLLLRHKVLSSGLGVLGIVSAILMLILYLGRLIILDATSLAIGVPALLEGFLVSPIWYIWLGILLLRK